MLPYMYRRWCLVGLLAILIGGCSSLDDGEYTGSSELEETSDGVRLEVSQPDGVNTTEPSDASVQSEPEANSETADTSESCKPSNQTTVSGLIVKHQMTAAESVNTRHPEKVRRELSDQRRLIIADSFLRWLGWLKTEPLWTPTKIRLCPNWRLT